MTREDAVKGLREVADWHYGKYEQTHEEDYLNDGDFLTSVANLLKAQDPVVIAGIELTDAELIEEIRKAPLVLKPNVDAVPVVRCRDCKYSDTFYKTTEDTMPLKCLNIRYGGVMPNWYCEHGERRDGA